MGGRKIKRYQAAGGVVLDAQGRVLLLRRNVRREKTPSLEMRLPKGHIEPGETPKQAAVREVCEESGYCHLAIVADLGELHNEFDFRNKHIVRDERYFLMRLTQPERQAPHHPHPHSEEALFEPLWAASLDEAEALLTFEAEKEFIRRARAWMIRNESMDDGP
ncbi:MAG TPA: NUDIX domain-containing protein [Anaerolineae bacterium]|nr:NUDIX domain-containing protein [Caldilineae bacterium]HID35184.1 NUDIX domain-containing protein [Anaerolineae bacterium]HIQ11730.1 NUDIX domain-containing protein [Caldilineales bacterium]